jgi:hypothetical protein
LRRCVGRPTRKILKKKLKDLERRTNEKGKGFLKGSMDKKEKWALTYDKGDKRCGYMTSNIDASQAPMHIKLCFSIFTLSLPLVLLVHLRIRSYLKH